MKTRHLFLAAGVLAAMAAVSCKKEKEPNTLPTESEIEVATEIDFTVTAPELGFANEPAVAVSLNGATPVSVRSFTPNDAGTEATFYAMFATDTKETRTFCAYSPYSSGFLAGSNGVNAIVATEQTAFDDQNPTVIDKAYALAFATTTINDNQAESASLEFHNIVAYGKLDISVLANTINVAKVEVTSDVPFAGTFGFDTGEVTFTAGDDSESTITIIPAAATQRVFTFACIPAETTTATIVVTTNTGSTYKGVVENLEGFTTRNTTEIKPTALMSFSVSNPASVYIGNQDYTWAGEITTSGLPDGTEVTFKIEYSADNGETWSETAPSWITGLTIGSDNKFEATIANSVKETIVPDTWLKSQASKGTATAPYDLSTNGGSISQNTANTYIINAAGYYSIPLVYGNAIQNGAVVEDTYNYSGTCHTDMTPTTKNPPEPAVYGQYLKHLVNYIDEGISSGYIYTDLEKYSKTIESACLVWEQVQGMVKNVALSEDKHSLTFEIDNTNIAEGNAIVAIKDNEGKIVWSWQIWVSCWVPGTHMVTVPSKWGNTADFPPVNLGWVNADDVKICEARSAKVRFTLEGIGLTEEKTIYVAGGYFYGEGFGSYYQWGRKDPVWIAGLSGEKNYMKRVKYYKADGTEFSPANSDNDAGTLGTAIQRPDKWIKPKDSTSGLRTFYTNGHNDTNNHNGNTDHGYNNLWNAQGAFNGGRVNSEDIEFVKTVYDPSPALFQVPSHNSLITKDNGYKTSKRVEIIAINERIVATDLNCYEVVDKTIALQFPQTGNLSMNGTLFNSNHSMLYTAAASNGKNADQAYHFRYYSTTNTDSFDQQITSSPAACPVRPCTNRTIAQ